MAEWTRSPPPPIITMLSGHSAARQPPMPGVLGHCRSVGAAAGWVAGGTPASFRAGMILRKLPELPRKHAGAKDAAMAPSRLRHATRLVNTGCKPVPHNDGRLTRPDQGAPAVRRVWAARRQAHGPGRSRARGRDGRQAPGATGGLPTSAWTAGEPAGATVDRLRSGPTQQSGSAGASPSRFGSGRRSQTPKPNPGS